MAREFTRTDRLGPQIQRELAELLRQELNDPRLGMITVQEVRVVRDLSYAKVYVTLMGGSLEIKETLKILNEAVPLLRHELGRRIKIRVMPKLQFVYDASIEQGNQLAGLIEQAVASDRHRPDDDQEG